MGQVVIRCDQCFRDFLKSKAWIRLSGFIPALPSEHEAWSFNFRGMRKQKGVKLELFAGVFPPARKQKQHKQSQTDKKHQPNKHKSQRRAGENPRKKGERNRAPKPLISSLPPCSVHLAIPNEDMPYHLKGLLKHNSACLWGSTKSDSFMRYNSRSDRQSAWKLERWGQININLKEWVEHP